MPHPVFAANNTALITGGASGIGLAVAQLCLRRGMRVAVADWNTDTLSKAKDILGGGVDTYQTDVSKPEAWATLKDGVLGKFGRVDFLMLNAGIGLKGTWGDSDYFEKVSFSAPHSPSTCCTLTRERRSRQTSSASSTA